MKSVRYDVWWRAHTRVLSYVNAAMPISAATPIRLNMRPIRRQVGDQFWNTIKGHLNEER